MGIKFSQLPIAASVAPDDYIAILDSSENVLKRMPTSHASTAPTFGLGTTAEYGHNKIVDNLTRSSFMSGEALSAHQGNVIANNIGPVEPTTTAAHAHLKDEYFMLIDQFVRCLADISVGDTITVGTNVQATDVGQELVDLRENAGSANFIGTVNDWTTLSSTEKAKYDKSRGGTVNLTDDGVANSNFTGTVQEWNSLSDAQKAAYDTSRGALVNFTNDDMPDDIIGTTSIAGIADGTLTGGVSYLNASLISQINILSAFSTLVSRAVQVKNNKLVEINITFDHAAPMFGGSGAKTIATGLPIPKNGNNAILNGIIGAGLDFVAMRGGVDSSGNLFIIVPSNNFASFSHMELSGVYISD